MKRWLAWIPVLLLLLSGCVASPKPTEDPAGQVGENQQLPEPGLYDPQSLIEQQTGGAVRAYPLGVSDCGEIGFIGQDVLLFSGSAQNKTVVTCLTGVNCTKGRSVELESSVAANTPQLRISGSRLAYYSTAGNCVIFLDADLQQIKRVALPADMLGAPVLSQDLSAVYYCTATELRRLDLETGISRLIRQQTRQTQAVTDTLFGDTVLQCFITEQNGRCYTEFISASDGKTLGKDENLGYLYAYGDTYFLSRTDGSVREHIWGKKDGAAQSLMPAEKESYLYSALEMNAILSVTQAENRPIGLALYDLTNGKKTAALALEGLPTVYAIGADPAQKAIWFLSYEEEQGLQTLYRWDVTASAVTDDGVYTGPRHTRENPDTEGLRQCQERANSLADQYGVRICVTDQVKEPADYSLVSEYQVAAFQKGLDDLEKVLARFPENFFRTLGKNGQLQIGLVRGIEPHGQNAVSEAVGLQYWVDGKACIALCIGDTMEQTFYHELSHALDAYIIGHSLAYDAWETLNPKGFRYDGNYQDYLARKDNTYTEGDKRAFIDHYSMTYAKEDRARLFEYAVLDGNEDHFASATMQKKLRQICIGIREAFDLEKDEQSFPWEQYLKESLAYQKK
ncbi:MAG: hypothetical protein J6Q53_02490 [Oscillospiraceae bacterium]|nr:hypothetical protein [Oscillospiraceae bacterium]